MRLFFCRHAAAFALLSACGSGENFDPPPAGGQLLPVLSSPRLRYYALEHQRSPDGRVRAIVFTQFPQPARNAAGYAGWEVECSNLYRMRGTGRGTLEEARSGREAESEWHHLDEGSIAREIAIRLCD